ncbi:MAG: MarR family transcriptional regulator [Clostridiales Family XIII bacterium]|jgi:DNA-binding MarR family transcriptional regulator|nr:MarR family transcriptional regulator [Clostridiales Family XIII bacterium]
MKKAEKTVDDILARLFVTTLKIEERAIAANFNNDLSISELHVIREIGIHDSKTMTQVAKGLKISVGALTTAMNKLEQKGYVLRMRDIGDRRIVNVCLTDAGRSAFDAHGAFHKKMVNAALSQLSANEKEVLLTALTRLDDYFIEEWNKCQAKPK